MIGGCYQTSCRVSPLSAEVRPDAQNIQCCAAPATHDNQQQLLYNMRRRKKDKLTKPSSYAEAAASAAAAENLLENPQLHYQSTIPTTTATGDSSSTPAVAVAEGVPTSSSSLGKISLLAMAKSRSPPQQQRRRSGLLGLSGSVRELVEQVLSVLSVSTCACFRDFFLLFDFQKDRDSSI